MLGVPYPVFTLCTRVPPKYEKLSDQFPDWGKVVPWIVLQKNGFSFEIALKLWSRRVAQFLRYDCCIT